MSYQFDIGDNASNTQRGLFIPTKIMENDLMCVNPEGNKDSSDASFCFVQQKFSSNLQAFMINYVISVSSNYSIYS